MDVRNVVGVLVFVLASGCAGVQFHARNGEPLPSVTEQAVVVGADEAAQVVAHGELVGTVDESGAGDLAGDAAAVAARGGGTHIAVRNAGVSTSTWVNPATETRTCTRADGTRTCETTYTPESTGEWDTPYSQYDVYRVDPAHWQDLPERLRPAAISADRRVPTGADGWGLTMGWFTEMAYPGPPASGTTGNVFPTAYTASSSQVQGVWIGGSRLRGSDVLAFDVGAGGGSFSGLATGMGRGNGGTVPYTTDYGGASFAVRVGKHVDWRYVSLSAGIGIGGALWVAGIPSAVEPSGPSYTFVQPPGDNVGDLWFPLWGSLTIKATCDWGVQGLASYDERPFDRSASGLTLAFGVIWQPASACR